MSINHHIKPFNVDLDNDEFTPTSLIDTINEKLTAAEAPKITIKGLCSEIGEQSYYGYYFGKLVDDEVSIKIKISEKLIAKVIPNTLCTMRGFLEKQISMRKDGNIGIVFRVAEIIGTRVCDSLNKVRKEQETLIAQKQKRGIANVKETIISALCDRGKARILLIGGEKSVAYNDVLQSLGAFKSYYVITEKRINLRNVEQVCEILNQADRSGNHDVVAIVRGGGDGLEVFSDIHIVRAAANIRSCCLVTALGHYEDQSVVDRIADYACGTPTDFGYFLAKAAGTIRAQSYHSKLKSSNRKAWLIAVIATIGFLLMLFQYFKF